MAEISFYHLQKQTLIEALALLLEKAEQAGLKSVLRFANKALLDDIDKKLWEISPASFVAHGSKNDQFAEMQPIFLTLKDDNPAKAEVLMVINDAGFEGIEAYARVLYIFNGNDGQILNHARDMWKKFRDQNMALKYWRQDEAGRWALKAE